MTLFYSKTTNGFYDDAVHETLPQDAVEISQELHQSLLEEQADGKVIQGDANGNPEAVVPEVLPPTLEEQQAKRQAAFTKEADPLGMQYMAGEIEKSVWDAKRAEIRARYPYPNE